MSNRALTWAFEQAVEPAGAKFVLVALADGAGDEDYSCISGQERLARMTGQGVRTVRRHLDDLERAGLIVRERRKRKDGSRTSDRCFLQVGDPKYPDCPVVDDEPDTPATEGNRPDWPLGRDTYRPNCAELPANLAGHEPSEEPKQHPPPPNGGSPPKAKSDGTNKRGTRLDPDWRLGEADRAYARSRGFSEAEIDDMAASFTAHFTVGGGRTRTWVRWSGANGAWGQWVRRETPRALRGSGKHDAGRDRRGPPSVVAAARRVLGQG
jgi:hypothetical protein